MPAKLSECGVERELVPVDVSKNAVPHDQPQTVAPLVAAPPSRL
jgi:hypothetical protein